ncbi:hypothetical protein L1987_17900 [Smallanthus sonchifolius]|uniref:Uncharacterized protein n=1 Tax=Smallanthus sonchifolius TaxID=185202 RepID=A0ACB9IZB2_9ASTR|nr:hypothetical protein L1987_17900 [Smallanthus sonchifolius]
MTYFRAILSTPFLITLVLLLCIESSSVVAEDDIKCLRGVQRSLHDPRSEISTWNFSNSTRGFICSFSGVTCWNAQENRLISLTLRDSGLAGSIPSDLLFCESLQNLDLSGNDLTGSIPSEICTWLPYLVNLDLSNNGFTGEIPASLGNCSFLNTVVLSGNKLSAGVLGAVGSLLLGVGLWWWCYRSNRKGRSGIDRDDDGSSSWADKVRPYKLAQVSLFRKPLVKVRLVDLMIATNSFSREYVIVSTQTGTTYRADLSDGSALAIKRLNTYWPTRFRIAVSSARGLAWLHHGCCPAILLQNVSSDAIFLDEDYNARIVDFGLARLLTSSSDQSNEISFANGDLGDYSSTMVASAKGDTYGFGVVLMELATGQRPLKPTTAEEGFKGNCVASQPRSRWSMYQVSEALKNIAQEPGISQHYDEFPPLFDINDKDDSV